MSKTDSGRDASASNPRARGRATLAAAAALTAADALLAQHASAATFEVNSLADGPADACDATCTLRDAITLANADAAADTIEFSAGLTGTIVLASEIPVQQPLTIAGPGAAQLALSGGDANRILNIDTDTPGDAIGISGLTLQDGLATGDNGGAILSSDVSLTLTDLVLSGSHADGAGGALAMNDGTLVMSRCRIENNSAGYIGGGIGFDGFSGGSSTGITISDSIISGNTSVASGGGIALYDVYTGPVRVERSTISGNTTTGGGGGKGGGVADGGGLWIEDAYDATTVHLVDSTFSGNTAAGAGGGISFGENFYALNEVVNSTIVGNTAEAGGGINFADIDSKTGDTFVLRNSTVTGNTATATAGGVLRGYSNPYSNTNTELAIVSSVIADNTAPTAPDIGTSGEVTGELTIGHSLVRDLVDVVYTEAPAGSVLTGVDPLLGPLADNGGPTLTRLPQPGSPLLDAGLAGDLVTDQRGETRTIDVAGIDNAAGSDGTDIGAVEAFVNSAPVLSDVAASSPIDEGGSTTLTGTITDADSGDGFTLTVDWGDGTSEDFTYPAGTTAFSETHAYPDDNPTGTPSDVYAIALSIDDGAGGTDTADTSTTVQNVAPTLTAVTASGPLQAGDTTTLAGNIGDVGIEDSFTLSVDWGDGNNSVFNYPAGTTAFSETHTYATEAPGGSYDIALTLQDDDGGSVPGAASVAVSNAPPLLSSLATSGTIDEGGVATLTGEIADTGGEALTLTVDWGDGSSDTYDYPAGTTSFSETHAYADDNPSGTPSDVYAIEVTLEDDGGGSASGTTAVTVDNVAPTLSDVAISPAQPDAGVPATLSGTIADVGAQDSFELVIDWGDGQTSTLPLAAGATEFSTAHTYADAGDVLVALTLEDDDTGTASDSLTFIVAGGATTPPPAVPNVIPTLGAGGLVTLVLLLVAVSKVALRRR
ncbi:choice-of-anchor Q domain-containing protein [Chiayiivirga flava]|uniref:CSLREA domain-containing protein n=1 Tax=Chiayiivirga flava TaxID=659595 RepID=A0A7W8D563_9GAMM|nr:choice-of-anchor Q domain-containing protein [Chiayiivirga flava]MBB5208124.1 CSLREA domain-containing protein [Chiayiivirga flava]